MKRGYRKELREAVICIAASIVVAAIVFYFGRTDTFLKNGYEIARQGYGEAARSYELVAEVEGKGRLPLMVEVNGRSYDEEYARERMNELLELLPDIICGDNTGLDNISEDLYLPSELADYPGIRLRWYPEDTELIGAGGSLNSGRLKERRHTGLKLVMSAGEIRREFIYELIIMPKPAEDAEALSLRLGEEIKRLEEEQRSDGSFILPSELDGIRLSYKPGADSSPLVIVLLGFTAAALIMLRPGEKIKKEKKRRERALLLDYSELVAKLLVYIGAGLTLRNAWFRIVEVYEAGRKNGREESCCYEEMKAAAALIGQGMPEIKAYRSFARACGLRPYLRLCTLLEQNLKNGDRQLKAALELEMREAFNERKNMAKRLGEEMSTKLLLPLFISMAGVMIIVSVPALMRLG